jgi:hypothetical protein
MCAARVLLQLGQCACRPWSPLGWPLSCASFLGTVAPHLQVHADCLCRLNMWVTVFC